MIQKLAKIEMSLDRWKHYLQLKFEVEGEDEDIEILESGDLFINNKEEEDREPINCDRCHKEITTETELKDHKLYTTGQKLFFVKTASRH